MKRTERFNKAKALADAILPCAHCKTRYPTRFMDAHHPAGRHGENLLRFIWLCRSCHNAAHHDPKWAESEGLLMSRAAELSDEDWNQHLKKFGF